MKAKKVSVAICLLTVFLASPTLARSYYGERIKVTGYWNGAAVVASRIQDRDSSKNPRDGQVEGSVNVVDTNRRLLQIGPFTINWTADTRFDDLVAAELEPGVVLEIRVVAAGRTALIASSIEAGSPTLEPGSVEFIGAVTAEEHGSGGNMNLAILNASVTLQPHLYNAAVLTARHDNNRPDTQLTLQLFGRPLIIGGELESRARHRDNYELEGIDQRTRIDIGGELEFFYPMSERYAAYVEIKGVQQTEVYSSDDELESAQALVRGEAWFYMHDFLIDNLGLQIGRQNFADHREWWWDTSLDAVRLIYDRGRINAELAVGKELWRVSTLEDIEPDEKDILRVLSRFSWAWIQGQNLELFGLLHRDSSGQSGLGVIVDEDLEDESDADLFWLGARASGRIASLPFGKIYYWADGARLSGNDTVSEFSDAGIDFSRLDALIPVSVSAWAYDAGLTWRFPDAGELSITLGFGRGSGDADLSDGIDGNFRQTGLHDNNGKFRGVDRFRYYGEVLRPELSNLDIFTFAIGRRFLQDSSIEAIYHRYTQADAASFMRDAAIRTDPSGLSTDIGSEIDLVIGFEEWNHFELEIVGGVFLPGDAFTGADGSALILDAKFTYNF